MQNPKTQTDDCITKSDGDSADAKQTERSFKGKGVGDFREIVRVWKVNVSAVALIHSRKY